MLLFVPAVEEIGGAVIAQGSVTFAEGTYAVSEIRQVFAVIGPIHFGSGRYDDVSRKEQYRADLL